MLSIGMRIGESDVAVRPQEIDCCAQQAGAPHMRLPRENVQWKLEFGADFGQALPRFAVHVNLPRQGSEQGEVVSYRLGLDPWQTIAAPDSAGLAHAQWAV